MQIFNLFPLSILKEKISLDQNTKKQMIEEIRIMVKNSKNENYKSDKSSWTGDTQGFEYICKNEKSKCAKSCNQQFLPAEPAFPCGDDNNNNNTSGFGL